MHWARAPGIRSYLFVFFSILTAIPDFWLGNSFASRTAERDRELHDRALSGLARSAARQLEAEIETRVRDLEVFAGSLELSGELDGPRARELLSNHWRRSRYYTGSYIGDVAGNALVRAPELPGPARSYRDRDYYQELLRTRATAISKAQEGHLLTSSSIQIASPIFAHSGALAGYAEGSVELADFAALLRRDTQEIPGSRLIVLDGEGGLVADSLPPDEPSARRLSTAPLFADLAKPAPSLRTAFDERGALSRAAFQHIELHLLDWRVAAVQPQRSIDDNARAARNQAWATALVVWLLALALAALIAASFGNRFRELAAAVSALGNGQRGRPLEPPRRFEPEELRVLVTQIGAMSVRLSRYTRDLEGMVEGRTAELAEVNRRLSILVNALERADDGIEITDPQARFIYVNPAMERVTGYTASELIGNTPKMLRSDRYDATFYEDIWLTVNGGQVYSGEFVARRKDGSLFDQELTLWPVQDAEGRITHFVGLRRDVSHRRRTEQSLRISERMASLGTLAAGVAHEINNPLTYVLLNLRFVREHLLGAEPRSGRSVERTRVAIERAEEGAERVSAIVKDLRTLSRPDDRSIRPLDPREVLDSALRMVGNDIRHRARLVHDFGPIPHVLGNHAQLGQAFVNLLVNAVQALDSRPADGAEIRVRTGTDENGFAVIEIGDNGAGIPPEHLARIFDPFFTTKPVGHGTGIGLAVCHGTIKAMHGEIQVESAVGVGSVFRIRLPGADLMQSLPIRTPPEPAPVGPAGRRLRVLILDDDHAVGEALSQALSSHEVTLLDGAEAGLEAVRHAAFDAVLCDVMMPGVTGLDFYQRLAEVNPAQQRRVVFITGGVLTEPARVFLEQSEVRCLEKPIDVEQLNVALLQLVADPDPGAPTPTGLSAPASALR